MKRSGLLFVPFLVLFFLFHACSDPTSPFAEEQQSAQNTDLETEVHELINKYRIDQNLEPLELHNVISEVARKHSQKMADGTTDFGHDGFSERVAKIREQIGGNGAAENVAFGYSSAESVVEGWINSSGHKRNIEGNYTHTGVGIAYSEDERPYFTQIFLKK